MPQIERRTNPHSPENSAKTQKLANDYLKLRQKIKDRLNPYKSEVVVQVDLKGDTPLRTVHVGDTHFAHDEASIGALQRAVKEVGEDGIMITHSNIIESVSPKFIRNNTTRIGFDLDEQEALAKEILRPVDEKKHLIMIGGNTCHEGWAVKNATHDPIPAMVGAETPVLYSGGQVVFESKEGKVAVFEGYHNGGEGRTKQSPEGSMRERSREIPVGKSDHAVALVDGHMHQLTVAQDVYHSPVLGKDVVVTLGEVGASKGSKERPDTFLISRGVPPRNQPADAGEGLEIIWKRKKKKLVPYPVAGYDRAKVLWNAEILWENAQRTGNAKELHEMILKNENSLPAVHLNKKELKTRKKDKAAMAEGKDAEAPLYKKLSYDISTKLPVRIQFIGNLRVGSPSLERTKVNEILGGIEANPWAFVFATRRLINQGVSRQADRERVLTRMADLLSRSKKSLLGVMLTDELRSHGWGREVRDNGRVKSKKMYPGDYLYLKSAIKGVPVIMPETVVLAKVGEVDYTLYLRDKLSHFTSLINPEHGLTRVHQIWGIDADVLVGGHTEIVGWRTWMRPWGQLEIVVPGGFSEYIEKGVGSRVDYPEGGQGVILFPRKNHKTVFSFATQQDGVDMHEALWLQEGLRSMKKLDEVSIKLQKVRK